MNQISVAEEFIKSINPSLKQVNIAPVLTEISKEKPNEFLDRTYDASGTTDTKTNLSCKHDYQQNEISLNRICTNHVTFQRTYKVLYLGYAVLDKRYTLPMLPWIVAEIKRGCTVNSEEIFLEVTDCSLKAVKSLNKKLVFEHKLQTISKFGQTAQDPACFTYMTREVANGPCAYHVFQAADECTVLELFTAVREVTKEMVSQQTQTSTPFLKSPSGATLDSIMTSCQYYEVLYLGRIKVSSKRAPPSFIDEAVEKFKVYEMEKARSQDVQGTSHNRHRHGSGTSVSSLPHSLDLVEHAKENELRLQSSKENLSGGSTQSSSENVNNNNLNVLNRSIRGSSADVFLDSPMSPVGNFNQFLRPSNSGLSLSSESEVLSSCSLMPPSSLIPHSQSLDSPSCAVVVEDLVEINSTSNYRDRIRSVSGDVSQTKQTSLPSYRSRVGSGGSSDMHRPRAFTSPTSCNRQRNRTMLFLIGRLEICLIGMDKKQILLSKTFNDIAHCSQGVKHLDHFGFICRETSSSGADCYAGYIFRCQTERVVDEMMHSLKLAFKRAHQDYQHHPQPRAPNVPKVCICEACPMQWFHRLCCDIEGVSTEITNYIINLRLDMLLDEDREEIMQKCEDADVNNLLEQNEVYMMLLRDFCEQKQRKHAHLLNGSNKNEFSFLKEKSSSKLDSFRQKAKKSLSSSFETFLKLKHKDDARERSATSVSESILSALHEIKSNKEDDFSSERRTREGSYAGYDSPDGGKSSAFAQRPRSSTFSTTQETRKASQKQKNEQQSSTPRSKSPIMNVFLKANYQSKRSSLNDGEDDDIPNKKGSWRQAIFHRVQTPVQQNTQITEPVVHSIEMQCMSTDSDVPKKKTPEELRALWRKAILEQILLIRMEKENKKLQVSQDAVFNKRMKLDYEEITPCLKDTAQEWDKLLNHPSRDQICMDKSKLQELVKTGVPRHKRGEIWQFLAEQHMQRSPSSHVSPEIDLSVPYDELLKQLTSQQHAILIDLGRTFPNHPFFAQPLGSGQLSLFNLLKAYSLLDREVGYCQGLSFVAGILLLHMPEEKAFLMMKHILFFLGLRRQYKPDMVALQIQMYQLSRLIHDNYKDLYDHLERYDIAPTLYAAPWFLTLYASQFPLGFVSRLFDLIFLQGMDTIFKVALVLLGNHRDLILHCFGFEAIMDFLKSALPNMDIIQMERVFNQVFTLDISVQLHAYEVEYHVLQEEMMYSPSRNDAELVRKLETANRNLKVQNLELMEQLQVAYSTIHNLEASEASYKSTAQRLEARIVSLEEEKEALTHSLGVMKQRLQKLEQACLNSEDIQSTIDADTLRPSFGMVYSLAGSEKEEELQLKQLIKDFCEERDHKDKHENGESLQINENTSGSISTRCKNGDHVASKNKSTVTATD